MGIAWVSADANDYWLLETLQKPAFRPRHRKPPRLASAVRVAADRPVVLVLSPGTHIRRRSGGRAWPAFAGHGRQRQ
ncbi:MAG TPA: hypothetical protein VGI64_18235 [Streptosporangiaceae bacterium]|jgi:hypothetical protein